MTTPQLFDEGFCVVEGVLDAIAVRDVRERLMVAAEESRRRGVDTFMPVLDPNDRNVRVFNLLDLDPVFVELIQHPRAIALVREVLGDVREANGATRYVPHSHRVTRQSELPSDALARSRPFEAPAGSIIAMDGRMWHTSGANTTQHDERALLFGYYSADFIRPQVNWNVVLSETTQASLSPQMVEWLGLGPAANAGRSTLVRQT